MSLQRRSDDRDYQKKPLTRKDTQLHFDAEGADKSLTQQHHNQGNCLDTTAIISKFFQTGIITHAVDSGHRYIDAVHYQDFAEAMNSKVRADRAFEALDPEFKLENKIESQEDFIKFALDEKNLDKMRAAGLANPIKGPAAPIEVKVIADAPPAPLPAP